MSVKFTVREIGTNYTFTLSIPMGKRLGVNEIQLYEDWVPFYNNIPNKPTWAELSSPIVKSYEILNTDNVQLNASFTRQNGSSERNPKIQVEISFKNVNPTPDFMYLGGYSQPAYGYTWNNSFKNSMLAYDATLQEIICFQPEYFTYESSYINESYNYVTWYTMLASPKAVKKGTYKSLPDSYVGSQKINNTSKDEIKAPIGSTIQTSFNVWHNTELYGKLFKTIKPSLYPDAPDNDNEPDAPVNGDGDTSSDAIPDPPPVPIWDVNNTGFVTVYNPTVQQIRELAYFMWSGDFADLIKKVLGNPFDAIVSLKMLFVDVPTGVTQTVWLGNVETTVSMPKLSKQFIDVDMGSLTVNEFFGSFADYAPFTKIQIFLPFIGYKDLNVDEVMNANLHLRYRVDVYSGACIAFLTVTKEIKSTSLNSILYQFDGNCAMELPFTQNDNSRYVAAILNSAASSALSLAATSGFTTPTAATGFSKGQGAQFELGSLAPVANGMLDVLSTKPNVQRAGSLAGAVAAMGVKQPYIIIHRPIAQMPTNYQHYLGIPLNLTRQLSTVSGYTIVSQVFMTSTTATEVEIVMITELLKNGVIF